MKKLFALLLLFPFFSFTLTNDTDVFFGDSITFGNELQSLQYSARWSTQYCNAIPTAEINDALSGATMTPGLNTGRPVFNINDVPNYQSSFRHIFVSYWVNDYLYGGTPAAFAAFTATAVDGIIAKGWPAEKIVLCFNYLPESPTSWVNMTNATAQQWLSALRSVQQLKGTSFLDFYTLIYNRTDKASYTLDLIHPTAAWNTIMKQYAITNIEGPSNPLPATLISFSGQRQGNGNLLKWTVAQEQNVKSYDVERSATGSNWVKIGTINSLGNSTTQRTYNFTDNAISGVKQFYRLSTVDKNGVVKLSNIIIINGAKPGMVMLSGLFPNPASSKLNLLLDAPEKDNIIIDLMDGMGRLVKTQKTIVDAGSNTIDLSIANLTAGSYLLKATSETSQQTVVSKFVKE